MVESASLKDNFMSLLKDRQLYWWIGHIIVTFNGLFYFSSVLSLNSNASYYQRAYLGALLSYAIVIYNSIGIKYNSSLDINILCDENVHYFVVAFYWYSSQPITVTLIPFFVFSLFHALTFFRTNVLTVIPTQFLSTTEEKETNHLISLLDGKIKHFTDTYHLSAMYYVAYIEVIGILGRIILGIVMLQTSVLALIVFIHFLRLRYYISDYTKEAIQNTTLHLDKWLLLPSAVDTPSSSKVKSRHSTTALTVVSNIYLSMKRLIIRYGSISTEQPSS